MSVAIARATIAAHSRSFALASRLLDRETRDATAVVYTFCRRADDAIDLGADPRAALARLEHELDAVYRDAPCDDDASRPDDPARPGSSRPDTHASLTGIVAPPDLARPGSSRPDEPARPAALDPILGAFARIVAVRSIPRGYPQALLDGMAMDVSGARYATVADLHAYCYRVAGVVGLMLCHVFGIRDDAALVPAARLGIAMQLTNICRDVAEDWARGRLYVPAELLAGAELEPGGPLPRSARAPLAAAVRELLALAEAHYRAADAGVPLLPWRAGVAVRAARRIYAAIGDVIARRGHDVTAPRAVVPTSRKLALAARALVAPPRRGRPRLPTRTLELADVPLA